MEGQFKLVSEETPKLEPNQVLIKVLYSSVNSYDKILMENKKCENLVLGAEGVGTIEDMAEGLDSNLKGRKVAFCSDGWS